MAKRFVDAGIGRKQWFRILPPAFKCAWRFLTEECDEAGVWSVDEESMSFHVGLKIPLDALIEAVNADGECRVKRLGRDKLILPGFIEFQYGTLSDACKPHLRVISRLKQLGLWERYSSDPKGYAKGFHTLEDKTIQDRTIQEEDKKGGVGGFAPAPIAGGEVSACLDEWRTTLAHFDVARPIGHRDEVEIARAVQAFGHEWVKLALQGARKQKPGKGYDPKQFVSLRIYLHKDRIERLVNIGAGKESVDGIDWGAVFGKAAS